MLQPKPALDFTLTKIEGVEHHLTFILIRQLASSICHELGDYNWEIIGLDGGTQLIGFIQNSATIQIELPASFAAGIYILRLIEKNGMSQ